MATGNLREFWFSLNVAVYNGRISDADWPTIRDGIDALAKLDGWKEILTDQVLGAGRGTIEKALASLGNLAGGVNWSDED
jgi:hypothetical protein